MDIHYTYRNLTLLYVLSVAFVLDYYLPSLNMSKRGPNCLVF